MENKISVKSKLVIFDRSALTLNGVKNIEGFDESYVSLDTELGQLIIEGKGLKIGSLSADGGDISISGQINSLYFSDKKSRKGIMGKLFG